MHGLTGDRVLMRTIWGNVTSTMETALRGDRKLLREPLAGATVFGAHGIGASAGSTREVLRLRWSCLGDRGLHRGENPGYLRNGE